MPAKKKVLITLLSLFSSLIFNFGLFIWFKQKLGFNLLRMPLFEIWAFVFFLFFIAVFYLAIIKIIDFLKNFFEFDSEKEKEKKEASLKRDFLIKYLSSTNLNSEKDNILNKNNNLEQPKIKQEQKTKIFPAVNQYEFVLKNPGVSSLKKIKNKFILFFKENKTLQTILKSINFFKAFKKIDLTKIPTNFFVTDKSIEKFIKDSISEGLPCGQIYRKLKAAGVKDNKIKLILNSFEGRIKLAETKRKEFNPKKTTTIILAEEKEKEKTKLNNTRISDLLNLALRIFKVKPTRTILTILGIGVSFGVILFLVSLGYGLQRNLLQQIASKESLLTLDVYSPNPDALSINNEAIKKFLNVRYVEKVSPVATLKGQITFEGVSYEVNFTGVSDSFDESAALKIISGFFLSESYGNEIVLTSFFTKLFDEKAENILEKEAFLTFFIPEKTEESGINGKIEKINFIKDSASFKIKGIIEDDTNNYIYIPFSFIENFNLPSYGSVKIKVTENIHLEEVRSKILEQGFSVSAISDTVAQANKIFKALQVILALFGIAALIVAVIGMINTMTIALLERIQEIGIMKVIGASDKDVERLFLLESLIIGFLGGISGLLIGVLSSQLFNLGVNILAKTLGGTGINLFYYPLWFIIAIILFSSFVGLLTGAIPAKKAGKMDPLQALRYK